MTIFGWKGRGSRATAALLGAGLVASVGLVPVVATASPATAGPTTITTTGLPVGAIKHVWLIIEENKSYDETFTGLNQNSYLWQTLPSQGVLLQNYYGTGHFSEDNYIALVSGQSPSYDLQDDCSTTAAMVNNDSGIVTTGSVSRTSTSPDPDLSDTDLTYTSSGTYTTGATTAGANNGNYGQILTHGGVNATLGNNGCVFPDSVPTLFNQFNAAGVSWKGYAQDLGGAQPVGSATYVTGSTPGVTDTVPGRDDGACAYPGVSTANPVTAPTALTTAGAEANPNDDVNSYTGAQPANALSGPSGSTPNGDPADQFVAKHFPFGWFASLQGQSAGTESSVTYPAVPAMNEPATDLPGEGSGTPNNCDASHIANLDDPTYGLVHDLQSESTTPAFSWITPNNCSDAHDATCQGDNLSGAFNSSGQPVYNPPGLPAYDPEATTPANYTGGLYAADLFLKYYVPLIEASPAFKDGGLIDVTFDEANPPFTVGNSFNNAKTPTDTGTLTPADQPSFGAPGTYAPGANSLYGAYGLLADGAGESFISGTTVTNVNYEPTGPNDPQVTDSSGDQLQPAPGASGFIDRPTGLTGENPALSGSPGTTAEPASFTATSSIITDPKINADDTGRIVTGTGIPTGSFVGAVTNTGPLFLAANASTSSGTAGANNNFAKPWTGSFQLVDDSGNPVLPTTTATNASPGGSGANDITLSAEGATASGSVTQDPLFDATDFTPGGGDTGSVLISPYITPGTVSTVNYNHYSWLRTMEDLFLTGATCTNPAGVTPVPAGTSVCGGLDGLGHIGYAAQTGLNPFGPDVFNNPTGSTPNPLLPESPLAIGLPLGALLTIGGVIFYRRRRQSRQALSI
jgi:hypothetical protein